MKVYYATCEKSHVPSLIKAKKDGIWAFKDFLEMTESNRKGESDEIGYQARKVFYATDEHGNIVSPPLGIIIFLSLGDYHLYEMWIYINPRIDIEKEKAKIGKKYADWSFSHWLQDLNSYPGIKFNIEIEFPSDEMCKRLYEYSSSVY